jgi:hypothetical protein
MRVAIAFLIALLAIGGLLFAGRTGLTTLRSDDGHTVQTSGESIAGRSQNMPPNQASDRSDTNESGQRAQALTQTEKSGQPVSASQVQQIQDYFASNPPNQTRTNFSVSVGASVPRQIGTQPLPPELIDIMQKYRGDEYVMLNNQMIVVEPKSRRIVAIVSL